MSLTDSVTGTPWPFEHANTKLKECREKALQLLRKRDVEKRGIPADGKVFVEDGEHGFVVDLGLAAQKHSGRDAKILTARLWSEYCSKPRDLNAFLSHGLKTRDEQMAAKAIADSEELVKTLVDPDEISSDVEALAASYEG